VALFRQWRDETDPLVRAVQLAELLKLALPGLTDDDMEDTGPEDWTRIVGAATGKMALVEMALKNGLSDGVEEAPSLISEDSTTTTTSQPSSPASPARKGGRGSKSSSRNITGRL
jgi:hypothetical protein